MRNKNDFENVGHLFWQQKFLYLYNKYQSQNRIQKSNNDAIFWLFYIQLIKLFLQAFKSHNRYQSKWIHNSTWLALVGTLPAAENPYLKIPNFTSYKGSSVKETNTIFHISEHVHGAYVSGDMLCHHFFCS